jgi:hypothetical protein
MMLYCEDYDELKKNCDTSSVLPLGYWYYSSPRVHLDVFPQNNLYHFSNINFFVWVKEPACNR